MIKRSSVIALLTAALIAPAAYGQVYNLSVAQGSAGCVSTGTCTTLVPSAKRIVFTSGCTLTSSAGGEADLVCGGASSFPAASANTVFAGPTTGSATTPAFRALVAADIPNLSATYLTTAGGQTIAALDTFSGRIVVGSVSDGAATIAIAGPDQTSVGVAGVPLTIKAGKGGNGDGVSSPNKGGNITLQGGDSGTAGGAGGTHAGGNAFVQGGTSLAQKGGTAGISGGMSSCNSCGGTLSDGGNVQIAGGTPGTGGSGGAVLLGYQSTSSNNLCYVDNGVTLTSTTATTCDIIFNSRINGDLVFKYLGSSRTISIATNTGSSAGDNLTVKAGTGGTGAAGGTGTFQGGTGGTSGNGGDAVLLAGARGSSGVFGGTVYVEATVGSSAANAGYVLIGTNVKGSTYQTVIGDSSAAMRLGFWAATPVLRQTATGDTNYSDSGATTVHSAGTFTGGVGSTAYTIGDVVKALKNYGLLTQ